MLVAVVVIITYERRRDSGAQDINIINGSGYVATVITVAMMVYVCHLRI